MALSDYDCMRIAHMLFNLARAYEMHMGMEHLHQMLGFTHQDLAGLFVIGQRAPLTARQLAKALGITPGTTSLYVQKLVEKGLLVKEQDQTDRRNWWLRLSPQGTQIYDSIMGATVHFTRDFSAALNDEEQAALLTLLKKAYQGVVEMIPHLGHDERIS